MAYAKIRTITVDHTQVVSSNKTNFVVRVAGTFANFKSTANGGLLRPDGFDLAFFASAPGDVPTTPLSFEPVAWNAVTGAYCFDVKIPTLSTTVDTVFYVAYGDAGQSVDPSNRTGTWDTTVYKNVYHGRLTDSTSSAKTLVPLGSDTAPTSTTDAGQPGTVLSFNGSTNSLGTSSPSFTAVPFAMLALYKPGSLVVNASLVGIYASAGNASNELVVRTDGAVRATQFSNNAALAAGTAVVGSWLAAAARFNSGAPTAHIQANGGATVDSAGTTTNAATLNQMAVGAQWAGASVTGQRANGLLGEVRFYTSSADDVWLRTDIANLTSATFVSLSVERAANSGSALTAGVLSNGTPGTTSVPLSWTSATGGTSPYTDAVQVSTDGGTTWGAQAYSSGNATGLTPSTPYVFRVRQVDSAGSPATVYTNTVSVTTAPSGNVAAFIPRTIDIPASVAQDTAAKTGYKYQIFRPSDAARTAAGWSGPYRAFLALHGGGELGTDGTKMMMGTGCLPQLLGYGAVADGSAATPDANFPWLVICPQMPDVWGSVDGTDTKSTNNDRILAVIPVLWEAIKADIQTTYGYDTTRLGITGLSAGGIQTWNLMVGLPREEFAWAIVAAGIMAKSLIRMRPGSLLDTASDIEARRYEAARMRQVPTQTFFGSADGSAVPTGAGQIYDVIDTMSPAPVDYTRNTVTTSTHTVVWTTAYKGPSGKPTLGDPLWTWAASKSIAESGVRVSSVSISPASPSVAVGGTTTLAANVVGTGGTPPQRVTWASANSAIATVNPWTGVVTGVALGTTTIGARSEDGTTLGTVSLSVVTQVPAPQIALAPTSHNLNAFNGGANPAPVSVSVTNAGTGTLDGLAVGTIAYGASQPTGWLAASLDTTTAPAILTLTATTGALPVGVYTATVPITSTANGVTNSPQNVSVTFNVVVTPSTGTAVFGVDRRRRMTIIVAAVRA